MRYRLRFIQVVAKSNLMLITIKQLSRYSVPPVVFHPVMSEYSMQGHTLFLAVKRGDNYEKSMKVLHPCIRFCQFHTDLRTIFEALKLELNPNQIIENL